MNATHNEPSIFSHTFNITDDSYIFIIGFVSSLNNGITIYGIS